MSSLNCVFSQPSKLVTEAYTRDPQLELTENNRITDRNGSFSSTDIQSSDGNTIERLDGLRERFDGIEPIMDRKYY
jgi:hypothetical protein